MEQNQFPTPAQSQVIYGPGPDAAASVRTFLANVFSFMTMALVISGVMAWWFGNDLTKLQYLINFETGGQTILGWVVMLAPLGFIFFLGFKVQSMSASAVQATFWAFAAVMGLSMASIFLVFTGSSIARTFFVTAAAFGALSLYGYTTKRSLSAMGSFMVIGLFGIIIASLVNIFLGSTGLQFVISILGVVIFAGLTAWDTQRLKEMYFEADRDSTTKMAVMGALTLYLDFINMFQFLLQFMGVRSNQE